jgi:hypothetical protein
MVSVLLLTSFVTNVYAAEGFPTSGLGLPSSGVGASEEYNEVKITLSGIAGQTGESVAEVDLTPSPCVTQSDTTCTGFSDIAIPGIGVGHLIVILHNHDGLSTTGVIMLFVAAALIFAPSTFKSTGGTLFGEGVIDTVDGVPPFSAHYTIQPELAP